MHDPYRALYLHLPFCVKRCSYCDFATAAVPAESPQIDEYVEDLCLQIRRQSKEGELGGISTVYLGGGTPSHVGMPRLSMLLYTLGLSMRLEPDVECTMEANPESLTSSMVRDIWALGANRLSLGVQSTDDALLRRIGRVHTYEQVQQAVTAARKAKIENLSLDLIYGLPDQTMEDWQRTLADAVALGPEHLSCYGLKLEEGTPLYERRAELTLPDEEQQADTYLYAVEFLKQCGYEQYEISNFARPGFVSRHNMKYWLLQEYAGFGPGAYSDFGNVRYGYARDLEGYLRGELVLQESETLDADEREREYLMLRLRTVRGIEPKEFEYRFRQRFEPLAALLRQCAGQGLAVEDEQGWHLTPKGFLVSNRIIGLLQDELAREKNRRLQAAARGDYRMV